MSNNWIKIEHSNLPESEVVAGVISSGQVARTNVGRLCSVGSEIASEGHYETIYGVTHYQSKNAVGVQLNESES